MANLLEKDTPPAAIQAERTSLLVADHSGDVITKLRLDKRLEDWTEDDFAVDKREGDKDGAGKSCGERRFC